MPSTIRRLETTELFVSAEEETGLSEWGTDRSFEVGLGKLVDAIEAMS